MATVVKYISELLHHHDCVIVPGLGGFVANHRAAVIQDGKQMFLPPAKEIGFNRSLIYNDGLLTDYVARCLGISYQQAQFMIDEFVEDVRIRINTGNIIDLGDVGTLRGDAIGNLQFSPGMGCSFLPEAFGLSSFRMAPLNYRQVVKIEKEIHVPGLLNSRSARYWSSVAALIAGLFFFSTMELKMPSISQSGFGGLISSPVEVPEVTDYSVVSEGEKQDYSGDQMIRNEKALEESDHLPENRMERESDKRYHLIAASFVRRSPAEKSVQEYITKGYSGTRILDNESGRFRIALQAFENRNEALQTLDELRLKPEFSAVWIYSMK